MEAWGPVGNSKSIQNLKEAVPFSTLEPSIPTDMCRSSCIGFNDYQCNSVTQSRAPGAGALGACRGREIHRLYD